MTIANAISLARLLLVPLIVWLLLTGATTTAFVLFVVAGVSDAVDGIIARRTGTRTRLGSYLDPLADKALLVGVFVALGLEGHLPGWLVGLVVGRDVLLVAGTVLSHLLRPVTRAMEPLLVSKLNTVAQIALASVCLARLAGIDGLSPAVMPLVWTVAATTVASGAMYALRWTGRRAADERSRPPDASRGRHGGVPDGDDI